MSTPDETRAALREAIDDAPDWTVEEVNHDAYAAALAEHERATRAHAVAGVIEFLESQTGPDEIVGSAHMAARAIQMWEDARADRIEARG